MSQSKIEFRLGAIRFTGEGDKEWVTRQLDKIIHNASTLIRVSRGSHEDADVKESYALSGKPLVAKNSKRGRKKSKADATPAKAAVLKSNFPVKELPSFIQSKKAGANQRAKFLATAIWLNKNGKQSPSTRDVTNALKAARIPALINPSQYLNQNVKQGYLKKSGSGFLVTKKGAAAL